MANPKNRRLRDAVYNATIAGIPQHKIVNLLHKRGFTANKTRVSQIVKELCQDGFIRCDISSNIKIYSKTRKSYLFFNESLQFPRGDCEHIRIHNQFIKIKIIKSEITNDKKLWDNIQIMRNGVKQYRYMGHCQGKEILIQRLEGKSKDTAVVRFQDMEWDFNSFEEGDYQKWFEENVKIVCRGIEHRFKIKIESIEHGKTHYAIQRPPDYVLQDAALKNTYSVGPIELDASKNEIPEVESTDSRQVINFIKNIKKVESENFERGMVQ